MAAEACTLVDKRRASRRSRRLLVVRQSCLCLLAAAFMGGGAPLSALTLSDADAQRIGKKIWQNECNGTVAGLTSWNEGENFASLGIGHFIWYPKGVRGPFDESFPKLVGFISRRGAKLPTLLLAPNELSCPWPTRREFLNGQDTAEMKQLRHFLAGTVDLQTQFMIARLAGIVAQNARASAVGRAAKNRAPFQRSRCHFKRLLRFGRLRKFQRRRDFAERTLSRSGMGSVTSSRRNAAVFCGRVRAFGGNCLTSPGAQFSSRAERVTMASGMVESHS